ncbi:hypothetical protein RBH26_04760 [Natronolimnohabitans sp. A-GB9]|uniref:hypothetical protein n=1 Tax=Natronolimnohabitans sp. A-GB9 TaxID=3069757 RepID=UPI0027B2DD62|nr:hypothetical protein [Natronolimnohabitans sp. A-GB9]MDQ2049787.1 hypothetical protein [Natronolimnohabitans sp. A-GB9]
MDRPYIRDPKGFKDVAALLFAYVIAVALVLELAIGFVRPVVAVGSVLVLGWLVWAVGRILESGAIEAAETDEAAEVDPTGSREIE